MRETFPTLILSHCLKNVQDKSASEVMEEAACEPTENWLNDVVKQSFELVLTRLQKKKKAQAGECEKKTSCEDKVSQLAQMVNQIR